LQCDLALALGKSIKEIKALDEQELNRWILYRDKFMFPQRRIELYLANLARLTAGGELSIDEFLFDPKEAEVITDVDAMREAMGFKPQDGG
jgi:hypothetical protein